MNVFVSLKIHQWYLFSFVCNDIYDKNQNKVFRFLLFYLIKNLQFNWDSPHSLPKTNKNNKFSTFCEKLGIWFCLLWRRERDFFESKHFFNWKSKWNFAKKMLFAQYIEITIKCFCEQWCFLIVNNVLIWKYDY